MTEPTVLRGRETSTLWLGARGAWICSGAAGANPKLEMINHTVNQPYSYTAFQHKVLKGVYRENAITMAKGSLWNYF